MQLTIMLTTAIVLAGLLFTALGSAERYYAIQAIENQETVRSW